MTNETNEEIYKKFFTENGTRYGTRFHKIKVHSVLNRNPDIEFAYKETIWIGPYELISQSITKMVNVTRLNEKLNEKLGDKNKVRESLNRVGIQKLMKDYTEEERKVLLAEDENGEIWAYRTIAAKMILLRDGSVDKMVLERIFEERMLDLPYESTETLKKIASRKEGIVLERQAEELLINTDSKRYSSPPYQGSSHTPTRGVRAQNIHWDSISQETKTFVLSIDNEIKQFFGIRKWNDLDHGAEPWIARKAVLMFLDAILAYNPDLTLTEAVDMTRRRLAE